MNMMPLPTFTLLQLLYSGSKILARCQVMRALVLPLSHKREHYSGAIHRAFIIRKYDVLDPSTGNRKTKLALVPGLLH
jgi:hypothetical protein